MKGLDPSRFAVSFLIPLEQLVPFLENLNLVREISFGAVPANTERKAAVKFSWIKTGLQCTENDVLSVKCKKAALCGPFSDSKFLLFLLYRFQKNHLHSCHDFFLHEMRQLQVFSRARGLTTLRSAGWSNRPTKRAGGTGAM